MTSISRIMRFSLLAAALTMGAATAAHAQNPCRMQKSNGKEFYRCNRPPGTVGRIGGAGPQRGGGPSGIVGGGDPGKPINCNFHKTPSCPQPQ
jgi:hypothetical protein